MLANPRTLTITYLVEEAQSPWGGVQTIFREADALYQRGHVVRILCKTGRPQWYDPLCEVFQVADFEPAVVPDSDLVIGTYCPTVPAAWKSGRGRPVHYCQGYEGDNERHASKLYLIERIYRLPGMAHIVIAPFLRDRLHERFAIDPIVVPYGIREDLFVPEPTARPIGTPVRVGLVGPWDVPWKDIRTGVLGARLARDTGVEVQLVRVSPCPLGAEEQEAWGDLDVEWHEGVRIESMPDLYRSFDLFLGTSNGGAEGFFLPAVEAMACGIPCILSDISCFRHYASDQEYAQFFQPGDAEELAEAIRTLATRDDLRAMLRASGMATAAQHTFAAHVDGMEQALQSLVPLGTALCEGGRPWAATSLEARKSYLEYDLVEMAALASASGEREWSLAASCAVTDLFPESADAWQIRGRLESHMGDLDAAEASLLEACRFDERSPSAHEVLGRIYFAKGDLARAVSALQEAVRLEMPGTATLLGLAKGLLALGRFEEVVPVLERVLELQPHDEEAARLRRVFRDKHVRV